MRDAFHKLTSSSLKQLAGSLREGELAAGITAHTVQQIAGSSLTEEIVRALTKMSLCGWSTLQIADLLVAVVETREQMARPEDQFDLVLSGPEMPGTPTRDTAAVMHTLFEQAREEVILVGYAVHNGKKLFERLAERMAEEPGLNVWFCLDIRREYTDTSLSSEIVRRFAMEFATKHWPWNPKPAVYYDPRSLDESRVSRSSLHAKCVVTDRRVALITSANFTEAAQQRNIEAGVVVRYAPFVDRVTSYFEGLRHSLLHECELPSTPTKGA